MELRSLEHQLRTLACSKGHVNRLGKDDVSILMQFHREGAHGKQSTSRFLELWVAPSCGGHVQDPLLSRTLIMSDDHRSEEERLADELLAELEEEFDDLVFEDEEEPEAAVEETAPVEDVRELTLEEKKARSEARAGEIEGPSEEAIRKAKEAAAAAKEKDVDEALGALEATSETAYTRHPIVSVLGHVDHGKTSILDRIRGSSVFDREAGAITQHIGASEVPLDVIMERAGPLLQGKNFGVPGLLCIDTPGHHAFTSLRGRGGQLADIAVLVVDLNEGFKPQTLESLNILRRSKTPFIVACNKIDRIEGWVTKDAPWILNQRTQNSEAMGRFEEKFYTLVGTFYEHGVPAERYDRIDDFTKNVAIVPTCAASGEGIPDLLAMLVGLAQKFLEGRLETDEEKPGEGTVLEVKEDKGLGQTLDVVLYAGSIRADDRILLGTRSGVPIETTIRSLLKPEALDEMRDARKAFKPQQEIVAAAGIKLVAPGIDEDVVSGAPLRVLRGFNDEEAWEAVEKASKVNIPLDDEGVFVKADTIGSLEAMVGELKAMSIPVRNAEVGDISRRDVVRAAAMTNPLYRVVLGFNVQMLPDVEREASEHELPVFKDAVIYSLVEDYQAWLDRKKAEIDASQRQERVHPAKLLFLEGCSFRQRDPAVFGVRILAGSIAPGRTILRKDNQQVGRIRSIQKETQTVTIAKQGDEVALSVPGPTLGRQIKEGDILYLDMPGSDAKWLSTKGNLTTDEKEALFEIMKIKRDGGDRFWGM